MEAVLKSVCFASEGSKPFSRWHHAKQVIAGMKMVFYDHPGSGETPGAGNGIREGSGQTKTFCSSSALLSLSISHCTASVPHRDNLHQDALSCGPIE